MGEGVGIKDVGTLCMYYIALIVKHCLGRASTETLTIVIKDCLVVHSEVF